MDKQVKNRGKKGILTIAVMLIGSVLLALILAISTYATSLSATNRGFASVERTATQIDSASHGLETLLEKEGVNVTHTRSMAQTNISFKLNLQGLPKYYADSDRFARFIAKQPGANISINTVEARRPKFYLHPQDIEADFGAPRWAMFTPKSAPYSAGSVLGYDVRIIIGQPSPVLNWTAQSVAAVGDPNALRVRIGVQGGSGAPSSYSGYLNRSDTSAVQLQNESSQVIMALYFEPPSALKIYYDAGNGSIENPGLNGTIETIMMLNGSTTTELGTSIINVNGAVTNTGPVIIDES